MSCLTDCYNLISLKAFLNDHSSNCLTPIQKKDRDLSRPTLQEATCGGRSSDPVASGGIGRSEFLNDSNLNPLPRKTPSRLAHRFTTSFCVASSFDVKTNGYIVHYRMDIEIVFAHFAS
jgi:hypothetical protein